MLIGSEKWNLKKMTMMMKNDKELHTLMYSSHSCSKQRVEKAEEEEETKGLLDLRCFDSVTVVTVVIVVIVVVCRRQEEKDCWKRDEKRH